MQLHFYALQDGFMQDQVKDISVAEKTPYHHGRLRQALLEEALNCVRQHGAENLSLRSLAKTIGVSQAAPYRHFADKNALLTALANEGFNCLASKMKQAMGDINADPVGALRRGGKAYLAFAELQPETYRLMYSAPKPESTEKEVQFCHLEAFKLLEQTVDAGLKSGLFKQQNKGSIVLASWSLVHGFAQLIIDGVVDSKQLNIETAFDGICTVVNDGIVSFQP